MQFINTEREHGGRGGRGRRSGGRGFSQGPKIFGPCRDGDACSRSGCRFIHPNSSAKAVDPGPPDFREFVVLNIKEIGYFLEDMKHNLQWFIDKAAEHHDKREIGESTEDILTLSGLEEDPVKKNAWGRLIPFAANPRPKHPFLQTLIEWNSPEHTLLRKQLGACRCRQGAVHLFKAANSVKSSDYFKAYRQYLLDSFPKFQFDDKLVETVAVVPFYKVWKDGVSQVFLFNVFELHKNHWAFVGGDITFSKDSSYVAAAQREWQEEAGELLGYSWDQSFVCSAEHFTGWNAAIYEGEIAASSGAYFANTADGKYLFLCAQQEFYENTSGEREMLLNSSVTNFVRINDKTNLKAVHTHGHLYVECDKSRWFMLEEYDSRGANLRPNNVDLGMCVGVVGVCVFMCVYMCIYVYV